jgi:hypothetical protein
MQALSTKKSFTRTESRIMTSRHEASKTGRDTSAGPLENLVAHPPHTPSQTPQIKQRAVTPQANRGGCDTCILKKQANCLETRNAFTFGIILEASIAFELVSRPMVLSIAQNTASVLRKLWPVPPEEKTLRYILGYGVTSDTRCRSPIQ